AHPVDDVEPHAFCSAPIGEAVDDLASVVAEISPDAIVSYDANGGYGHPDHVRAHEIALAAAQRFGTPFFEIVPPGAARLSDDLVLDTGDEAEALRAALAAHATQ